GDFVFPLPASARIDTLLLGCTHYPLLRAVIASVAGDGVAIVDSATATASALVELLAINGLEAPLGADATAGTMADGRGAEPPARRGLVDWAGAERVAVDRLKTVPGSLSAAELRATEPLYAAAMERIVPRLSEALGTALPGVVERSAVVDRAGWVHANIATF